MKQHDIVFIKGDRCEEWFEIEGLPPEAVAHLYLRCSKANLFVELPYVEDKNLYCLFLPSEVTRRLPHCITEYTLVANLISGDDLTLIQGGHFTILRRRNMPTRRTRG